MSVSLLDFFTLKVHYMIYGLCTLGILFYFTYNCVHESNKSAKAVFVPLEDM